jgi:ferrochelatase
VILNVRPRKSAAKYRTIWREDGSPLLAIGRRQQAALRAALSHALGTDVPVALGMRYGKPSIAEALAVLQVAGVQRLLVLPLYPQYSATTVGSTFDAVSNVLQRYRWLPELRMITHYHDAPRYIAALANAISAHWSAQGQPDKLLFSFHGLPQRYFAAGDPYYCECQKTARLVAERLNLPSEKWAVTFQSRFGSERWIEPYTDMTLAHDGNAGIGHVQVICPGFAADCLETLEEIAIENRDVFLNAGGKTFSYIPALNDAPDHIDLLCDVALRGMSGWPELASHAYAAQPEPSPA